MRLLFSVFLATMALAQPPVFPLKVSADHRHLTGADGRPFLYFADTAWAIVKHRTPGEIDEYLDRRAAQGFTAIQIHAVSKEVSPPAAYDGIAPFADLDDITRPNEAYWRKIDYVVDACTKRNMAVAISALWIRWGGSDKEGWRFQLTPANAGKYGQFLGRRYARYKNVIWILGGDANPRDRARPIGLMAEAIKSAAPHHLITVHNAPENPSSNFFGGQPWLDINMCYTYRETYQQVYGEWHRPGAIRPLLLGESGYELEDNDKRGGSPYRIRRQAWGAMLSGALGGQAYGHREIWRMSDQWRSALDSAGTRHMQVWHKFFAALAWQTLVPQREAREAELVSDGGGLFGADDYVSAAIAADRSFAVAYLPVGRALRVKPSGLAAGKRIDAYRVDPASGERTVAQSDDGTYAAPAKNSAGDPDWVLYLAVKK